MALSADDYREQLLALLPPGPAWLSVDDLLDGLAQELARIEARAIALVGEADPSTTAELLADWERVAGLPEPCSADVVLTDPQRRQALVIKLINNGGASRQFFIDLAAAAGFSVTIAEFGPFRVGMRVGNRLTGPGWAYAWEVNAALAITTVSNFRAGQNRVGDRLRRWGNTQLECLMTTHKPAHTTVIFAYA